MEISVGTSAACQETRYPVLPVEIPGCSRVVVARNIKPGQIEPLYQFLPNKGNWGQKLSQKCTRGRWEPASGQVGTSIGMQKMLRTSRCVPQRRNRRRGERDRKSYRLTNNRQRIQHADFMWSLAQINCKSKNIRWHLRDNLEISTFPGCMVILRNYC